MSTTRTSSTTATGAGSAGPGVDPRGPRFAAWVTSAVLAVVLLTASPWLLAVQALVFAFGVMGRNPYALVWKRLPHAPSPEREDPRPLRFAQLVGLAFAVVGLAGTGTPVLLVATAAALVAALLNAAFGICLGCEMYLIIRRMTDRGATA